MPRTDTPDWHSPHLPWPGGNSGSHPHHSTARRTVFGLDGDFRRFPGTPSPRLKVRSSFLRRPPTPLPCTLPGTIVPWNNAPALYMPGKTTTGWKAQ